MRTVAVLAYDGVQLLDVTGPVEVFETARERGADYVLFVASPDGADVHAGPMRIGADASYDELPEELDTLIVPGSPNWRLAVTDPRVIEAVRRGAVRSRRVASVCAGTFLLAAAGLLEGRRAATHWELADELAREFPRIDVDADAIFVSDGSIHTSAGITAGIDLSLALVEADHGAELARDVARHLVVFMQRPGGQAQFSTRLGLGATAHPTLRKVLDRVAEEPAADHSVSALSERAGFSPRHLTRVFRRELGLTPARYVERVRVEAAKSRLERSDEPLDAVARAVGFGSEETLRRAFRREAATTPAGYRARFRTTGAADRYVGVAVNGDTEEAHA
jgi:transcriptional regulator GlxA family with amidase domain